MKDDSGKTNGFLGEQPWDKAYLRKCYFRDFVLKVGSDQAM